MDFDNLNDAVMFILLETVMWDSSTGDPCDPEIWTTILPQP
jgi:hypothetical protein